ncbi:MAG: hypothetical protein B6D34_12755 [Candidatus Brocadia sp. UTAMX1]|jgi:hypothetical protein|nr:MAG: hypothetical protein B6D34_12755 [Candidatus Brocadia sp. UTAMX1]
MEGFFIPFNCRDLLIRILSVKEKYGKAQTHILCKNPVLTLRPEVLSVPINPHKKGFNSFVKSSIKQRLLHVPVPVKISFGKMLKLRVKMFEKRVVGPLIGRLLPSFCVRISIHA